MLRVVLVQVSETPKCSLDSIFQLRRYDLLALLLDDLLRVILAALLVHSRTEPDNALRTRMAHVNANEHRPRKELTGKSKVEEISSQLRVDLSENVRGNRKIHTFSPSKVLVAHAL